jgi:hypothetical protein
MEQTKLPSRGVNTDVQYTGCKEYRAEGEPQRTYSLLQMLYGWSYERSQVLILQSYDEGSERMVLSM